MSADRTTTIARAWAIARREGMVLGFTDHDATLAFEGVSFRPDAGLTARAVVQGLGLSVDNTEAQGVLSDDAIVTKLREEGVDIARRTVAKYREALRIPSSVERRREKAATA